MSKGGVGAEIILSAVMEGGGSGNKVSTPASQAFSLPSKLAIVTNDQKLVRERIHAEG